MRQLKDLSHGSTIVIRVNLQHPYRSQLLSGIGLSLSCFTILVNGSFQGFFNLKLMLHLAKITSKYRDWAPLTSASWVGELQEIFVSRGNLTHVIVEQKGDNSKWSLSDVPLNSSY